MPAKMPEAILGPIDALKFKSSRKSSALTMVRILVDADACPVKDEIYRVAFRREVPVERGQQQPLARARPSPGRAGASSPTAFDAADDWIAEQADARTVVITGDILLADRCLKAGATVIGHNGKPFTAA